MIKVRAACAHSASVASRLRIDVFNDPVRAILVRSARGYAPRRRVRAAADDRSVSSLPLDQTRL